MIQPTHELGTAGRGVFDSVSQSPSFDVRDLHVLMLLCDVTDLENLARKRLVEKIEDEKLQRSYASLVQKKLLILGSLGLTPQSRAKLGEVPVNEEAEDLRKFATE